MAVYSTLNKPEFTKCKYETDCHGCGIYPERPKGCRIYSCQWLIDESIDEKYWPKDAGFIINKNELKLDKNYNVDLARMLINDFANKGITLSVRKMDLISI